jgi:basic membrane lipoprotein Med (substrate-binding protein (PBP1-ABC) superfamily)
MKKINKLFVLGIAMLLTGCNTTGQTTPNYDETNVLVIFDGDEGDGYNDLYRRAIEDNAKNDLNVKVSTYNLGYAPEMFNEDLQGKLNEKTYDATIIFGEKATVELEPTIKMYQGYKFITIDANQQALHNNETSVDFDPEDYGYVAGQISAQTSNNKKISYFSTYQSSYENRKLYGFIQGAKNKDSGIRILENYVEENSCPIKIKDYAKEAISTYKVDTMYGSLNEVNSASLNENKGSSQVILDFDSKFEDNKTDTYLTKDYSKIINTVFTNIAKKEFNFNSRYEYGIDGEYIKVNKKSEYGVIKDLTDYSKSEFESLKEEVLIDKSSSYTPKYTSTAAYHEAMPNCSDTMDWKYNPRTGADGGAKPASWKCLGIWSTIYPQDGKPLSKNTGIEFKNMKTYGYSTRKGWVLIEHANPVGAFYEKDFVNDYHKDIDGNAFNYKDEKRTKILLNNKTKGFNYHPFGQQNDLEAIDLVDIEYVISTMDIRLIVWDNEQSIDIDDAKYVANIGGDWWSYKGATWQPDWSTNRDVCVGQFRIITKEWKTLYMSSVPVDKYDSIVGDLSFLNE